MESVIVYCGGKCGSMTLARTFHNAMYNVIHTHGKNTTLYSYENGRRVTKGYSNPDELFTFIKNQKSKVYIIDSYRDPIERKVSSFFYNNRKRANGSFPEVSEMFEKVSKEIEEYHPINEVFEHLGVEPFKQFDFEKRYNIATIGNVTLIKIRFKEISSWGNILSEIFKKRIEIVSDNLSKNTFLKQQFLKGYTPVGVVLDQEFCIYNSPKEQCEYKGKWKFK
jgi:hypothetical protein